MFRFLFVLFLWEDEDGNLDIVEDIRQFKKCKKQNITGHLKVIKKIYIPCIYESIETVGKFGAGKYAI